MGKAQSVDQPMRSVKLSLGSNTVSSSPHMSCMFLDPGSWQTSDDDEQMRLVLPNPAGMPCGCGEFYTLT